MLINKTSIISFISVKPLLIFCLLGLMHNSQAITLIVNESIVESPSFSKSIRNIFALQKLYWQNGSRIYIFVFPDNHKLHQNFSKNITNIFPHQYRRIWDRLTFSGTGIAPTTVNSIEEMLEKVSQTKNSIGYINQAINYKNIRIIEVENTSGVNSE